MQQVQRQHQQGIKQRHRQRPQLRLKRRTHQQQLGQTRWQCTKFICFRATFNSECTWNKYTHKFNNREHTTAQNTRSTSQQQHSSASSSNTTTNTNLDRQSPYNAAMASPSTTSISSPAAPQHGVIYQSGKSPNPSSASTASTGINLTASTTETGNLKISYEKQSSRVSQIQEQDSAPIRRSRSRSGESSMLQAQQQQQQQQQNNSKSTSRSGKKRAASNKAQTNTNTTDSSNPPQEKLSKTSANASINSASSSSPVPPAHYRSDLTTPTPPPTAPPLIITTTQ
ncbi:hypothetical protein EVAR_70379_1 [Eumeta japonica]|uniref:Uncharacterized protein n=1 Tax=Eumeta variegata TaxID=151549 RepID=A0A4C1TBY7_EUMVA|nr:hypothetical protein EVAR_70379_1 [Eumeta japonica]